MNRMVRYLHWCKNRIAIAWYLFFMWTPWGKAYICTALKRYLESDWFKERSKIFVKRQAFEMYFDSNESWFFKRAITRREKLGMTFAPFNYIKAAKEMVREKGLMDYI
jgi:hypothetical protein